MTDETTNTIRAAGSQPPSAPKLLRGYKARLADWKARQHRTGSSRIAGPRHWHARCPAGVQGVDLHRRNRHDDLRFFVQGERLARASPTLHHRSSSEVRARFEGECVVDRREWQGVQSVIGEEGGEGTCTLMPGSKRNSQAAGFPGDD